MKNSIKGWTLNNKRRTVIVISISALFALFLTVGYQIDRFCEVNINFRSVFAFGGLTICLSLVLFLLYVLFDKIRIKNEMYLRMSSGKLYFVILGILLSMYCLQFLIFYPGIFAYDSEWQYQMYLGIRPFTEHHPVLHTIILGFLVSAVERFTGNFNLAVATCTLFQVSISALCFSYMELYVLKRLRKIWPFVVSMIYVGFFPTLIMQIMSTTKDAFFMDFVVLSITLTIEMLDNMKAFCGKLPKVVLWIVSITLMTIFRNNCLYAIPFLIIPIWGILKEKKLQFVYLVVGFISLFLLYKLLLVPLVVTEPVDGREKLSVPIQQLLRIYYSDDAKLTMEERETIEALFTENGVCLYEPSLADYPKYYMDMNYYNENKREINRMYVDLVSRYPKIAIESFLENTCGFWYPDTKLTLTFQSRGYWNFVNQSDCSADSKIPVLYDLYLKFQTYEFARNPIIKWFFAPASFFYLFIVMFAYVIDKRKWIYLPVFLFILMLWFTYLLGPVALVRYTTYLFAIIPLYLIIIFDKEPQE